MTKRRLLVLACTQRKRPDSGLMPAVERYDGPAYRVLRRYLREDGESPTVWVLSAEYGLIEATRAIPDYDLRMTPARTEALRSQVVGALRILATEGPFEQGLVCAGAVYRGLLEALPNAIGCPVRFTEGAIGAHLAALKAWLYGDAEGMAVREGGGPVKFHGREIVMAAAEVERLAAERATADPAGSKLYSGWYVPTAAGPVAPKWLVSELTDVPPARFRTAEALRVLAGLGVIPVRP